jgi:hypothetical protein
VSGFCISVFSVYSGFTSESVLFPSSFCPTGVYCLGFNEADGKVFTVIEVCIFAVFLGFTDAAEVAMF